jgi:ribonuclease G
LSKKVIINNKDFETRVALLENSELVELYIQREQDIFVGNIYKGHVVKVLPGMQSAFIDIGMEKTAFLSVNDIYTEVDEDFDFKKNKNYNLDISKILKEGQKIIVQVSKEPIGTKGPRVTTNITIAGRYLVLIPMVPNIGISRKIENEEIRETLNQTLDELFSVHGYGLIARTASEKVSSRLIRKDYEYLIKTWNEILKRKEKQAGKGLLYTEEDVSIRFIRDILTDSVDKIVIDDEKTYKELYRYLNRYDTKSKKLLDYYDKNEAIFDAYRIEHEIERAIDKKVWLKSGGYIIIDQTEALVSIDVNSGRYVGKKNVEETILNINLEAAKEIACQLRLRNLGGIIIIDFIDMEKQSHKDKILSTLKTELKKDREKTDVIGLSELGLVEMTRKRTQESLRKTICEPCFYCSGRGYIKSSKTLVSEIYRIVRREFLDSEVKGIEIFLNPLLVDYIYQNKINFFESLAKKYSKNINFKEEVDFHYEQYEISLKT